MSLKLFNVDVETFVVVLAEDSNSAENFVRSSSHGSIFELSSSEILEGANIFAREIETRKDLDIYWSESEPYISKKDYNNKLNDDIVDLTCSQILEDREEELEKIKQKEIADKDQLKFLFA